MGEMSLFCSKPHFFVPGLRTREEVSDWAAGKKAITEKKEPPSLLFTPPLFRRRLGVLCKMTVQVVHDAVVEEDCAQKKQVFLTLRGDLSRQFAINKSLLLEKQVSPAAFSLSVFNAPIALSTIALSLQGGYSVIIPSLADFCSGVLAASSPVLCGEEDSLLLVYGDQAVPEEYGALCPAENDAFAFSVLLSKEKTQHCAYSVELSHKTLLNPKVFLHTLLAQEELKDAQ